GWVFNVLPWTIHAPSSVASGYIADWLIANYCSITLARKYIQLFSAIVYASCMFAIGYSTTFVSALGLFCACACADGLTAGGAYSNPQDLAPNHTGALYGVMNTLAALPGFISVYSSGILLKHFGSWVPVFSIAGGVMVTGTITFLAMGSGKRIV
uniref:Solute carrier family 17 member 9-like n=1 Tax=Saccoglossus kowalevskii TaxID=10224 RepID=A0ABM0MML7_SACKO